MAVITSSSPPMAPKRVRFSNILGDAAAPVKGVPSFAPSRRRTIASTRELQTSLSKPHETPTRPPSRMLHKQDLAGTAPGTSASVYPSQEQGFAKPQAHFPAIGDSDLQQQRRETPAQPPAPKTPENQVDVLARRAEPCRAPRRKSGQELFRSAGDSFQTPRNMRKLDLKPTVPEQSGPRTPPNPEPWR